MKTMRVTNSQLRDEGDTGRTLWGGAKEAAKRDIIPLRRVSVKTRRKRPVPDMVGRKESG